MQRMVKSATAYTINVRINVIIIMDSSLVKFFMSFFNRHICYFVFLFMKNSCDRILLQSLVQQI